MAHSSQTYGSTDQRTDIPDVGFSPTELYGLSDDIANNIYIINTKWMTLKHAYNKIGDEKDNEILRNEVYTTQLSINPVVAQTSKDIARLTELMRRGDKQQKLQIEKLTSNFKNALQRYSDMQKSIADKMKRHMVINRFKHINPSNDMLNTTDPEELERLCQAKEEEQGVTQRSLEFQQELLLEREDMIKRVEGDILDVNQIMRDLAALVYQQGDAINTIENHIEDVQGNVELGAQELIKGSNYQSKYRRKVFVLLLLAIIVVVILIIVLVTKLH